METDKPEQTAVNDSATHESFDAWLTHLRSPDVPVKFAKTISLGWGYTYFVRRGDAIKIGHTAVPKSRIGQLQNGFPEALDILAIVPNSIIDEPAAHEKFAHLRVRGEWFRAAPELLEFIEAVKVEAGGLPKRPPHFVKPAELTALQVYLLKVRPSLPAAAQPHASNLIQQIKNIETGDDARRLTPFIAESMRRLEAARQ
jgi:hypothetical protein